MALINNGTAVVTGPVTLIWDGISRPEEVAAKGDKPASMKYTAKAAIPANDPALAELQQLVNAEVTKAFPTGVPRGFTHTLQAEPADGIPEVVGQFVTVGTTYGTPPAIYDAQGREVAANTCGLYPGAKVRLILSGRVYNSQGNVGSSCWLSGIQIVDLSTPKLSVAAGMTRSDVANAFGIQGGAAAFAPAPSGHAPQPAPAPNPGMLAAPTPPAPPAPPAPAPAGPQLTADAAAGGLTIQSYLQTGWTLETLRQHGKLIG